MPEGHDVAPSVSIVVLFDVVEHRFAAPVEAAEVGGRDDFPVLRAVTPSYPMESPGEEPTRLLEAEIVPVIPRVPLPQVTAPRKSPQNALATT